MEEMKRALLQLYNLEDVPNDALEALVKEGFHLKSLERLSYQDWKEMVLDKTIPLPRALLFDIKYAMQGSEKEHLFEETRKFASKSVIKLIEIDRNEDIQYCGSFTLLNSQGIGVTALHSVTEENQIKQDSLRVLFEGELFTLEHLMSYPLHDISFYQVKGMQEEAPCAKLGFISTIAPGQNIWLVSFNTTDSQEHPFDIKGPDIVKGQTIKINDNLIKGHYVSFPGCSGGSVIDAAGSLLGIHLGKDYYEDHSVYKPNKGNEELIGDVMVRGLSLPSSSSNPFEDA